MSASHARTYTSIDFFPFLIEIFTFLISKWWVDHDLHQTPQKTNTTKYLSAKKNKQSTGGFSKFEKQASALAWQPRSGFRAPYVDFSNRLPSWGAPLSFPRVGGFPSVDSLDKASFPTAVWWVEKWETWGQVGKLFENFSSIVGNDCHGNCSICGLFGGHYYCEFRSWHIVGIKLNKLI